MEKLEDAATDSVPGCDLWFDGYDSTANSLDNEWTGELFPREKQRDAPRADG